MTFIQNKDAEIESLHKALTQHNRSLVYFLSATNPSGRKLLDSFILLNSLIVKNLGFQIVIISSATYENATVFYKDYPLLKDVFQVFRQIWLGILAYVRTCSH